MKARKGLVAGGAHWVIAAIALWAVVGVSHAATAKDRKRDKAVTESKTVTEPKTSEQGYIGVYMQDLTAEVRKGLDLAVDKGVLVSGVEEDAPAAGAGIEEGDVIVSFDGKSVTSADELRDAVRAVEPGREARVELVRDGKSRTVTLTVGERPEAYGFRFDSEGDFDEFPMHLGRAFALMGGPRLGVEAHAIEDDGLASYFGAKKGDGLLVLSVDESSIAGKAGVKPGDIIRQVGDEKVADVEDVRSALRDYKEGDAFDIGVLRHGKSQTLKATMDDQEHEFAFRVPGAGAYRWHGTAPRARIHHQEMRDDLRRELDDLRQELRELKEELEQRNDG